LHLYQSLNRMRRYKTTIFKLPKGALIGVFLLLFFCFVFVVSLIDYQDPNGLTLVYLNNENLNEYHDYGRIETVVKYDYYYLNADNCENEEYNISLMKKIIQLKNGPFGLGVCIDFKDDCQYGKVVEYLDFYQTVADSLGMIFYDSKFWLMKNQMPKFKIEIKNSTPNCGNVLIAENEYFQQVEKKLNQSKKEKLDSSFVGMDTYLYCAIGVIFILIINSVFCSSLR